MNANGQRLADNLSCIISSLYLNHSTAHNPTVHSSNSKDNYAHTNTFHYNKLQRWLPISTFLHSSNRRGIHLAKRYTNSSRTLALYGHMLARLAPKEFSFQGFFLYISISAIKAVSARTFHTSIQTYLIIELKKRLGQAFCWCLHTGW